MYTSPGTNTSVHTKSNTGTPKFQYNFQIYTYTQGSNHQVGDCDELLGIRIVLSIAKTIKYLKE